MMVVVLLLPRRKRGRPSAQAEEIYQRQRVAFCALIIEIQSGMDFKVGVRGWAYILEGRGCISKGEFAVAEAFITDCRKSGDLPLDICAEDSSRETVGLQPLDEADPRAHARGWLDYVRDDMPDNYTPFGFWDGQEIYVECVVEKIDLRNLFEQVCAEFYVPITSLKGWADLNQRAAIIRRFAPHQRAGRQCVLLVCVDHDPGGLHISDFIRKNLGDLVALCRELDWSPSPDDLIIDRFGLNKDFIDEHGLTWIDNLETSSGQRLDDPRHPDHSKPYVQSYLRQFGARKVEANAVVVVPEIGRQLCRDTSCATSMPTLLPTIRTAWRLLAVSCGAFSMRCCRREASDGQTHEQKSDEQKDREQKEQERED